MKLPLSLLKSFLSIDLPLQKIAETLTLLGIEVDAILQEHPPFTGVVAARVQSASPHPNAEKLRIAEVDDGTTLRQIVCGAPNCREGLTVALAQIGARLTDAKGQSFTIKAAKLRGVESQGMLCSAAELHLSEDHEGIIELDADFTPGQDLLSALWDPVFELSLTPNLGYCLSARGLAKELAAALNQSLLDVPSPSYRIEGVQTLRALVEDSHLCPRYMGRTIRGVRIGPSPFWLQQTLRAAGLRPINNAVDITNYLLLKWGQPMHAFDADLLEGDSLFIRSASEETPLLCLDGVNRAVPKGTLLICDAAQPLAIAGVMGGSSSSVTEKTANIFLEVALFDPIAIRKASKAIDLRSESSLRFEKGIDPEAMQASLDEACQLFATLCGGTICSGTIDTHPKPFPKRTIRCRKNRVNQILGTTLSLHEIEEIFSRLQFAAHLAEPETLLISVPFHRSDLTEEIDLIEEIARIYGYNTIEKKDPLYQTAELPHDPLFLFENTVRKRLAASGLQEVLTCDLISPKLADLALEIRLPHIEPLQVLHAKSEEYSLLRPSLLPGFLHLIQQNLDQKNHSLAAFEVGHIYFEQKGQKTECPMAGIFLTGKSAPHHWDRKPSDFDFYDLKGILENLFEGLHLSSISYKASTHPSFHPGRQASLFLQDLSIGSFGEIHPRLLEPLDIKQPVLYAEISLLPLLTSQETSPVMRSLSLFPSSERDWTIPLAHRTSIQVIWDALAKCASPLLEKVELLDVFSAETKNVTLRFTYRDRLKTISFEEAEAAHTTITQIVLASLQ